MRPPPASFPLLHNSQGQLPLPSHNQRDWTDTITYYAKQNNGVAATVIIFDKDHSDATSDYFWLWHHSSRVLIDSLHNDLSHLLTNPQVTLYHVKQIWQRYDPVTNQLSTL